MVNKIPFLEGQRLEETDLDKIIVSVSNDIAYHYDNQEVPWSKIDRFGGIDGINWCTHHFMADSANPSMGNHRSQKYVIPAFNLLVLDIDHNCSIESAQEILKKYTYCLYTTKRHTDTEPRFRIILPMKYKLFLNKDDYSAFMTNVFESLPFTGLDSQTKDISRKWLTNNGTVYKNEGELFDPRPYIPDTSQDKERKEKFKNYGDVDNVTRWFLQNTANGNRNNNLYRYGMMLRDVGYALDEVKSKMTELNSRLEQPLDLAELTSIFDSVSVS